jgi:capsular polysaccharide biosynthesis protein
VNDPDRIVAWLDAIDDELPAPPWAPGGLTADEDPGGGDATGGLVSLAFFREALRRATWLWCLTALLGLVIGTGLYVRYPPAYHAQTSVLLVDEANQDPAVEVLTDQNLAESEPVAARVVRELGLRQSVASLQAAYSVTPITYTVLQFEVGAPSAAAAVQRASALATAYLQYRAKYAQTQEQQEVAQLNQEASAAQQSFEAIDTQISQLPTTQLTPPQKLQLDSLQTQLADQKQTMQYATGTEAATKASTAAMVSGSYILDPPTLIAHSRVKGAALYVAGGLFVGLVLGMALVIVAALLSNRLRRRDDVAAALGAPVRLSVGSLRAPGRLPALPRRAAKRDRDVKRVSAYLQGRVSGSSRGPASLAVVAVDDPQTVASAVASLARARVRAGGQVVVADLSSGAPLARLLGAKGPGVHDVSQDGGRLLVAVPERDDLTPVGPMGDGSSPALWAQPDEAVVAAYSSADLLLTLVTLDPALGADHLATWASEAIAVVTAGRASAEKVNSAGEMIRLAGIRLDSAVLIGADRNDESLGVEVTGAARAPSFQPLCQCRFHRRQGRSFFISFRPEGDGERPRYG